MKHFLFILAFFAALCSFRSVATAEEASSAQPSQQFLNPIFNERLQTISRFVSGWDIYLSPLGITNIETGKNKTFTNLKECHMVEQTQTRVLMECLNNKQQSYYYLFVSVGRYEKDPQYCQVAYFYDTKKIDINAPQPQFISYGGYITQNKNCGATEKPFPFEIK